MLAASAFDTLLLPFLAMPPQKTVFAVAVSGGSDSVALALLTKQWCDRHAAQNATVIALTVDHRLRPESTAEAEQVAKWMAQYPIPHRILTWQHDGIATLTGNLLAEARKARYQLLSDYCTQHALTALLIGHSEDDQAETIALRQERRAGAVGLAGISARSIWAGIPVLRPLLATSRHILQEFLTANHQPWLSDPSNENPHFARIRIRQALQNNPSARNNLLQRGKEMAQERQKIEQDFLDFAEKSVRWYPPHPLAITRADWQNLMPEKAADALSRLLVAVSGRDYPPRYRELERLAQHLHEPRGKATLSCCIIQWNETSILIHPERVDKSKNTTHISEEAEKSDTLRFLLPQPFFLL
jgi:tRNA(Ile)-lysidine synthase